MRDRAVILIHVMSLKQICLIGSVITYCLFPSFTNAQVLPDGTTPTTNITGNCLVKCDITGGIQAESNLFHSFREFNVGRGESIYFADPGVANIFTRVTGSNSTEIFGKLGVTGNANLWLLNPQGIIFGNGATLDVNGSFVATTADEIAFGDRGYFSATPNSSENLPLLTVNPSAFFYSQMGQNEPIIIEQASLNLSPQESLVLLGAQNNPSSPGILIKESLVNAPQGNIQIGAATHNSLVKINPDLQLQFSEDINKGDITITQGSQIDTTGIGGGRINIQGAKLNIVDSRISSATLGDTNGLDIGISAKTLNLKRSQIFTSSFGTGNGSNIKINTDSIDIKGNGVEKFQQLVAQTLSGELSSSNTNLLGIITSAENTGAAGKISINSNNILITDGGLIGSATYSSGQGSNIAVTATDRIELNSSAIVSISAINTTGDAGNIVFDSEELLIKNGSAISTNTFGQGRGGDITVKARESIELSQTPFNALIPTAIFTNSLFPNSGIAGNISIETKNLTITDGGQISSASGLLTNQGILPFGGEGGNININATESVTISGSSANGIFPSSIISDTRSSSPAGNIEIKTGAFFLNGQAIVSASSIGTGDGGNLTINATESIRLNGTGQANLLTLVQDSLSPENLSITNIRGGLFTVGFAGNTQNIILKTPILSLNNGSLISTATFGAGNAGSINIKAFETVEIIQSVISSTTLGTGNAGDINIDTRNLLIRNGGSLITSNFGFGQAGDMTINATELVELANDEDYVNNTFVRGGIITSKIGEWGTGAGNLSINTKNLIVRDGLEINISNQNSTQLTETDNDNISEINISALPSTAEPNNSIIQARESILITGSSNDGRYISNINSTTKNNSPANNIQIVTPQLTVFDGANISVSSSSNGAAGSLEIIANNINLDGGALNANTVSGLGGNISLTIADTIQMSDRATITTNALNQGDGGNISIDTDFIVAFADSNITADAIAGKGGNIQIESQEIFMASPNQISASSQLGVDGEVKIATFTNNLRNNLVKLPENIPETKNKIVSRCGAADELGEGSFVYIGKGALSPSPFEGNVERDEFIVDWGNESTIATYEIEPPPQKQMVEATGWIVGDRGNLILTAKNSSDGLLPHYDATCPFRD